MIAELFVSMDKEGGAGAVVLLTRGSGGVDTWGRTSWWEDEGRGTGKGKRKG